MKLTVEHENDVIGAVLAAVRGILQSKREAIFRTMEEVTDLGQDFTLKLKATISLEGQPSVDVEAGWARKAKASAVIDFDQMRMELGDGGKHEDAKDAKEDHESHESSRTGGGGQKVLEDYPGDEMCERAAEVVRVTGRASLSALQRRLKVTNTMAHRLMGILEVRGIVTKTADGYEPVGAKEG